MDVFLDEKRYISDKIVTVSQVPIVFDSHIESIIGKVQIDYFKFLFIKGFEIHKI